MHKSSWGHPIFSLPVRVIPQPWEDLPSLIIRTAQQMSYKNPQWILRSQDIAYQIETYNLCFLWKATDYQILQKLLVVDEETIYQCTYHRFTPQLQGPEEEQKREHIRGEIHRPLLGYGSMDDAFRPFSSAKVCSHCLTEKIPYGRLYWNLRFLLICPQHNIFLIDQCPDCHKPIPTMRPSLIHCPYCKTGDYRRAHTLEAYSNPYFRVSQQLILRHFLVENIQQVDEMVLLAGSPLVELPSWDYFLLLKAFLTTLPFLFPDDPFLQPYPVILGKLRHHSEIRQPLSLAEWTVITTTFHSIFDTWPERFFAFLDALVRCRGNAGVASHEKQDFGSFSSRWVSKDLKMPSFFFLCKAYKGYLMTCYTGESRLPAQEQYSVTITRAIKMLDLFPDEAELLINRGILRVAREPIRLPNKTLSRRIEKASVEKLLQGWKELYPFYKVAYTLLNVDQEVMNILQENGWLIPTKGPSIDNYPLHMYNTMDVDAFTASLLSRSVKGPRLAGESLSLRALSRSSIVAISKILSAIFQGQLIPSDTGTMQPLFQRLVLSHTDIRGWQTMQKPKNGERVLLTREEVAEILAIRKHVITHLLQHGLLVEEYNLYGSVPVFQSEMVEAFRQTYVFLREVAVLLDETPAMVYRYVKDGRLRPILGANATAHKTNLLFRREEIRSFLLDYPSIYQKWS